MTSDLERRLTALTENASMGDWADVVGRAQRRHAATLRRRALILTAALAILAVPALAIATGHGDILSLSSTKEDVPPPRGETILGYVFGDRLHLPNRPPARLAATVLAPFLGKYTALVIPSPDGRRVVYHAWEPADGGEPSDGTPLLRTFDTETGRDIVLERGAHSAAWRRDGALAYTKALVPQYRSSDPWTTAGRVGHLMVRRSLGQRPVRWSSLPTEYVAHAWANRDLLVETRVSSVFRGRQPDLGLYAFSGPHRSRRLPIGGLTALSPDGRLAIGPAGPPDDFEGRSLLRAVEVSSGRVITELDLRRVREPELEPGLRSGIAGGSWLGDTIILRTGVGETNGLLVLRFRDDRLTVEQVLTLTSEVAEATGLKGAILLSFGLPVFVDRAAREFTSELTLLQTRFASPEEHAISLYLTCDRIARHCRRGRSLVPLSRWAALVYNPSRPS